MNIQNMIRHRRFPGRPLSSEETHAVAGAGPAAALPAGPYPMPRQPRPDQGWLAPAPVPERPIDVLM